MHTHSAPYWIIFVESITQKVSECVIGAAIEVLKLWYVSYHRRSIHFTQFIFIDSSVLSASAWMWAGFAWRHSSLKAPPLPSSEVDVSVYIPLFYFSIFSTRTPFFPQARAPWTQRWTTKLTNGSPISPLFIRELSGPDEIQLWLSPLRRGGKAQGLRLFAGPPLVLRRFPFRICIYFTLSNGSGFPYRPQTECSDKFFELFKMRFSRLFVAAWRHGG